MASWSPGTISSTATSSFPMALFMAVNNGQKITFNLGSAVSQAATLRIATTLSFAGGRPQGAVNGFTCTAPGAPAKIDSRGVTRGAYRGHGDVYECTIPAGTLVAGTNTVTITVISGSSGDTFLSPNVVSISSATREDDDLLIILRSLTPLSCSTKLGIPNNGVTLSAVRWVLP